MTEEGDSLRSVLEETAWWSPIPDDFPRLLRVPEKQSFISLLQQSRNAQPGLTDRSYIDQFAFLVIAICAAIPVLNLPYTQEAQYPMKPVEELKSIFDFLTEEWGVVSVAPVAAGTKAPDTGIPGKGDKVAQATASGSNTPKSAKRDSVNLFSGSPYR